MRGNIDITTILATAFTLVSKTWAAPDPNFHIYLAFGQSNMQGDGKIENQDRVVDKRFKMLATAGGCNNRRVGEWYDAVPPLANCAGGLGPVDYFGRTLLKKLPEQIKVGVAVVAVAGCDIQLFEKDNYRSYNMPDWMVGIVNGYNGNPYGRLIEMGKKAKEAGVIKGILLHQGETNTGQQDWPDRVKKIYQNIINDLSLNADEVPLLVGEVVNADSGGACAYHNEVIKRVPQLIKNSYVISSKGLPQKGDGLHFTSAGYRTFGERFADTMLKILGNVSVVDNGSQGGQGSQGSQNQPSTGSTSKINDGWYYITNTNSNKYLSVRNGVGANSQNVELGSTQQKWKLTNNSDGSVTLVSEVGDFALDVSGGSSDNGANVQIYSNYGGDAQKFYIREVSSNVYTITTKVSNGEKALDAEGARTSDGTNILQWTDEGKSNQTWTFKSAESNNGSGEQKQDNSCWSTALGYPCCDTCVSVSFEDGDGKWGIQNDDWCGLQKSCFANNTCSGAQGYPCCKSSCDVYSSDNDGNWSIENDDWCLIDEAKC